MSIQKFRWSRVYESSEEELTTLLTARNLTPERIVGEADSQQLAQLSPLDLTIWCAEGSLTVRTTTQSMSLQPGDALRIEAGTSYDLLSGVTGYTYYRTS